MDLTSHLPQPRRARVEGRLTSNLMAWLTMVRPSGRPVRVPVWFLVRDDDEILLYSEPSKAKSANIANNPAVALGLDVTDLGRDVIRIRGTARHAPGVPPADQVAEYVVKYAARIASMFCTPAAFAQAYSEPVLITPLRLFA